MRAVELHPGAGIGHDDLAAGGGSGLAVGPRRAGVAAKRALNSPGRGAGSSGCTSTLVAGACGSAGAAVAGRQAQAASHAGRRWSTASRRPLSAGQGAASWAPAPPEADGGVRCARRRQRAPGRGVVPAVPPWAGAVALWGFTMGGTVATLVGTSLPRMRPQLRGHLGNEVEKALIAGRRDSTRRHRPSRRGSPRAAAPRRSGMCPSVASDREHRAGPGGPCRRLSSRKRRTISSPSRPR